MATSGDEQSNSLQDLFASLRSSSSKSSQTNSGKNESVGPAPQQSYPFQFMNPLSQSRASEPPQAPAQSPGVLQSFNGFQSHGSGTLSSNAPPQKSATTSPGDQSGTDRAANLLDLLKFTHRSSSSNPSTPQPQSFISRTDVHNPPPTVRLNPQPSHGRGMSASDLVASFMGGPVNAPTRENVSAYSPAVKLVAEQPKPSTGRPQDFLLELLNRPKPTTMSTQPQSQGSASSEQPLPQAIVENISEDLANTSTQKSHVHIPTSDVGSPTARTESPIRVFGGPDSKDTTPFEPKDMPKIEPPKESLFTYVNPFEQLAASSPRNAKSRSGNATPQRGGPKSTLQGTLQGAHAEGGKRKSTETSPARTSSASRRRLTPGGSEILQSIETPAPARFGETRSNLEALINVGAPTNDPETVAEALNEVGKQASRQADHALAQAVQTEENVKIKDEELEHEQEAILDAVEGGLRSIAMDVKEEMAKEKNKGVLKDMIPGAAVETIKQIIDDAAKGNVDVGHGSADEEKGEFKDETASAVPVYNFPLKPFVSIDIKQDKPCSQHLREDAVMEIARLKKEFDQIDRTLATASSKFILYALPKAGGLRIIRQEDGVDRQVFKETHDRVFNAAVSTAAPGSALTDVQTFIATAVSGSVYWATICQSGSDIIDEDSIETHSLTFPPVPAHDENTSGGQLKTRAKKSSRHPEFFAIGRGKCIQIVFPSHAQSSGFVSANAVVESEKYFKERSLRINTGKAGKDFTFSEDDSVITTLDKAGNLRFWDIRDLVHESNGIVSKIAPVEVKTPILSFATAAANEKSWPTSVLFVDKVRPYSKCIALRYLIVGLKQNHTLQLWDLGLGKAVQELNFPHQKESDAICSVCYHSASGMIVVGHPTRNSIYFIHLSAPKYNLPPMSQAKYMQRLADKDVTLPKPESTAIMSGMREYSFSSKGQLRSLDLLASDAVRNINSDEDPTLFELYVMHSKGVTCLNIKKEDLGWTLDTKVLNPLDAQEHHLIDVRELREPQATALSERSSVNGDNMPGQIVLPESTSKGPLKESLKNPSTAATAGKPVKSIDNAGNVETPALSEFKTYTGPRNGGDKSEKKKKKRTAGTPGEQLINIPPHIPVAPDSYAAAAQRAAAPSAVRSEAFGKESRRSTLVKMASVDAPEVAPALPEYQSHRNIASAETISVGISPDFLDKELKKVEKVVSDEFSAVLGRELGILYRRFDDDKRVQDAAGAAKQDAILRLVSSTLTENVERALARIVQTCIQQLVVPSIAEVTTSTLSEKVPEFLTQHLLHTLPTQLKLSLPEAVSKSVQSPDVLRVLSDQVTTKIATHVERQFSTILHQTIAPAFQALAVSAAQRMTAETELRVSEQFKLVDIVRREDTAKIDQLTALVRGLTETVHAMAAAQSGFQSEILKLQQQSLHDRQITSSKNSQRQITEASLDESELPELPISPEQQELNEITTSMQEGRFEEGTIQVK